MEQSKYINHLNILTNVHIFSEMELLAQDTVDIDYVIIDICIPDFFLILGKEEACV